MSRGGGWRGGAGGRDGQDGHGQGPGRRDERRVADPQRPGSRYAEPGRSERPAAPPMRFPSDSVKGRFDGFGPSSEPRLTSFDARDPRDARDLRDPRGPGRQPSRDAAVERNQRPYGPRSPRQYERHGRGQAEREVRPLTRSVDPTYQEVELLAGDVSRLEPFELFCVYHLGLWRDAQTRAPHLVDTARRIGIEPGLLKHALTQHRLDPESISQTRFDVELARMDIQVSPPGISKRELARSLYQELVEELEGLPPASAASQAQGADLSASE